MKLLIVDDSNIIRSRIMRIAALPQFSEIQIIGQAKDGVEALALSAKNKPDLITLDMTMPNMDGTDCLAVLVERYPAVNILIISALSDKATAIKALKMGAHGFLHKPFSDEQLIEALMEFFE